MPKPRPPHLHYEETRHGVRVWYVRRGHGPRMRIKAVYDTPEFWAQYRAALEGVSAVAKPPKTSSLKWAFDRYRNSSAWAALSPSTRRARENIIRQVIKTAGDEPLREIDAETIRAGRERRSAKPHSANAFLRTMRGFFAWAVEEKHVPVDPTAGVKFLTGPNDENGFHTWTQEELDRFETRWPIGTRERLAYDLLLYTGLRRGDAVRVGRQHTSIVEIALPDGSKVRQQQIAIRAEKHRKGKAGELITIPIFEPLAASIAATTVGDMTYLVTAEGRPWVKESFGNWFRDVCREADCPGSAHGLRKAGAVRIAERGATDRQLMAMYGWTTSKQSTRYTRAADRARLARSAAELMLPEQSENKNFPHLAPGAGAKAKRRAKSGA